MNPTRVDEKLFFIAGCGRSGTTLLKSILNNHSAIHVPAETMFYTSISTKSITGNKKEKADFILSRWWIKELGLDKDDILKNAVKYESLYSDWDSLFLSLLECIAGQNEYSLFGEKTPGHINLANELLERYSKCRFIHIIRDPRAILVSFKNVKVGTNQVASVIDQWNNAYKIHNQLISHPRYYFLKYEDLILNPESALNKICNFLNINYDEKMLDFHKRNSTGFSEEQNHHLNTLRPIFSDSLNKWSKKINTTNQGLIESYCREGMAMMNYQSELSPIKFRMIKYNTSCLLEFFDRAFIRRIRQKNKAFKANRRLKL